MLHMVMPDFACSNSNVMNFFFPEIYTNRPVNINRVADSATLCGQCENVKAKLVCQEIQCQRAVTISVSSPTFSMKCYNTPCLARAPPLFIQSTVKVGPRTFLCGRQDPEFTDKVAVVSMV